MQRTVRVSEGLNAQGRPEVVVMLEGDPADERPVLFRAWRNPVGSVEIWPAQRQRFSPEGEVKQPGC